MPQSGPPHTVPGRHTMSALLRSCFFDGVFGLSRRKGQAAGAAKNDAPMGPQWWSHRKSFAMPLILCNFDVSGGKATSGHAIQYIQVSAHCGEGMLGPDLLIMETCHRPGPMPSEKTQPFNKQDDLVQVQVHVRTLLQLNALRKTNPYSKDSCTHKLMSHNHGVFRIPFSNGDESFTNSAHFWTSCVFSIGNHQTHSGSMEILTSTHTTQHNTTQHNTTQHNTTQHNTTQHNTTQHNTTQHNTTQPQHEMHTTTWSDFAIWIKLTQLLSLFLGLGAAFLHPPCFHSPSAGL